MLRLTPHLLNLVSTPQFSQTATTTIGINTSFEAIKITHVGPDEEGNLKIKCIEEFVDPEAYKNTMQVIAAAKAKLNE